MRVVALQARQKADAPWRQAAETLCRQFQDQKPIVGDGYSVIACSREEVRCSAIVESGELNTL